MTTERPAAARPRPLRSLGGGAQLLVAFLMLPPAASAAAVEMNFPVDFGRLHVSIVAELADGNASAMRQAVDQSGDRNGYATQDEADRLANQHRNEIATAFQRAFSGDNVTLDGEAPEASRLNDLRLVGVAGLVASTAPIAVEIRLDLFFGPSADARHTLRIDRPDPGAMLVEAPPGSVVAEQSGLGDAQVRDDLRVVAGTTATDPVVVSFGPPDQESPGPALVPLALLGAAALARRLRSA